MNTFATKRVDKLILQFAIPGIISLLVNSIYNMVDQIFIGRGVGYLGTAATNVAFPMVTIALSIALLIGSGAATYYSLNLGKGNLEEAGNCFGNALTLLIGSGIIYLVLGLIFLKPLLGLFGATELVMPYALPYAGICLLGLPFVILATGLNNLIRADGSPRYAMISMLVGAVINTILDPIFIFAFKWGVSGAALATIMGQIATFLVSLSYVRKLKQIKFQISFMRLRPRVCSRLMTMGISSFLTQLAFLLIQIILNNSLIYYGALSSYGKEIPLACMGIVMKVNQILLAFVIGISIGAQPIIGYNYGAKQMHRVRAAYKASVLMASVFAVAGFICFRLFPRQIVLFFGDQGDLFTEFAVTCFRTFLLCIFVAGFQIISANYFQAIGRPFKAALLSLSRQVLLLIPLIIIFPRFFGLMGILYAGPVADGTAALITAFFIFREFKKESKIMEDADG